MNKLALNQKRLADHKKVGIVTTNLKRKSHSSIIEGSVLESLWNFAFSVSDFRRTGKGNIRHKLGDIIIFMIFAGMSKCDGRADIIEYGKHNLHKFQSINLLTNGVPSEPTLCRVENGIDELGLADKMAELMQSFYCELYRACALLDIICIDGKAMRGTIQDNGRNPDIVSAYSYSTGLTLATEACGEKSNEIKAVPLL